LIGLQLGGADVVGAADDVGAADEVGAGAELLPPDDPPEHPARSIAPAAITMELFTISFTVNPPVYGDKNRAGGT
jgi:hypothetical protein